LSLFYYVLILLLAILLSSFINRHIPVLSVPLLQIGLGVCLAFLPGGLNPGLDPTLFLLMFIAPLLFYDGMQADKKSLWALKKPIFLLAFGLVLLSVLVLGYMVHWLTPSIPLAAAFALAAALSPTDAVAVGSIAKKVNMPYNLLGILEGEALINDASGIISFQFALAAVMTGAFSLWRAGLALVAVAAGGALVGAALTWAKYQLTKWLRAHGMENVTEHILIGVLTPFIIYIAADALHVSGILAVVTSGLIHSFERKRLNPDIASLNIALASTWSTLSFTLNGLVFLILGTQLPAAVSVIWNDPRISDVRGVAFVLAVTLALMVFRFLWALCAINKKTYKEDGISRARAALIVSLSGARGSVTLATVMSIPFLLRTGVPFPQRELIVFTAAGVIVCTLLAANFLLPLLFEPVRKPDTLEGETEARLEMIRGTITWLGQQTTHENRRAVNRVLRDYRNREQELRRKLEAERAGGPAFKKEGRLKEPDQTEDGAVLREKTAGFEAAMPTPESVGGRNGREPKRGVISRLSKDEDAPVVAEITAQSFQIERDYIQTMFENGRISRETAKKLRESITVLELELQQQGF